jgi:Zn-dependent protease with chaperone function
MKAGVIAQAENEPLRSALYAGWLRRWFEYEADEIAKAYAGTHDRLFGAQSR